MFLSIVAQLACMRPPEPDQVTKLYLALLDKLTDGMIGQVMTDGMIAQIMTDGVIAQIMTDGMITQISI